MHRNRELVRNFCLALAEGRVPGRIQKVYYDLVSLLGRKFTNSRTRDGYILSYLSKTRSIYVEVWQKHDYDFEDFSFEKGSIIIDIGANQGLFSVYAARNGAIIHAFEPMHENLLVLDKNVSQNDMHELVNVHRLAVTGTSYEVDFFVGLDQRGDIISGSASIVDENRGSERHSRRVAKGIPINEVLRFCGVTRCDFLKVDCEGGEYAIFENISLENLRQIDRISLEYHSGKSDKICDKLINAGFSIVRHDGGQSGLIKAKLAKIAPQTHV